MKGAYVLILKLMKNSKIKIGKLGIMNFKKGYYCYVGSALGKSINLENRVRRHKKLIRNKIGKAKWHIDYFLKNLNVLLEGVILFPGKNECEISKFFEEHADKTISKFGSTDCRKCEGHFHYFKNIKKILSLLGR